MNGFSLLAFITLSVAAGSAAAQIAMTDPAAITRPTLEGRGAPRPGAGAGIQKPVPLERPNPRYPRAALRRRIEGSVLLEFAVDPDGHVVAPRVVDATPPG